MSGVELGDVRIEGEIKNLVINGVDVAPLVEAELEGLTDGMEGRRAVRRFLLGRSYQDWAELEESERWFRSGIERGLEAGVPWAPYASEARWQLSWVLLVRGDWDAALALNTGPPNVANLPPDNASRKSYEAFERDRGAVPVPRRRRIRRHAAGSRPL